MNEQNLRYLSDQLKYTGFGESLQSQLKENIQRQTPEFTLQHRVHYGDQELHAALHFKKSPTSELYFFNRYLASLKQAGSDPKVHQWFDIEKNNPVTLKEAFNMMQGRAVYKQLTDGQGQLYHAWLVLDLKNKDASGNHPIRRIHQNYGFDLEKSLAQLPIKELADPEQKSRLFASLYEGNRVRVALTEGGQEQQVLLETSPQYKAIIVSGQKVPDQNVQQNLAYARQHPDKAQQIIRQDPGQHPSHLDRAKQKGPRLSP